ncbi:MAG TPA: MFS transporter [Candidatus Eisenbacteria bacterium]|nr:MFS transporter [Candidatus Eisenbacteria bacterium]
MADPVGLLREYAAQVRGASRNPRLYLAGMFLFGVGQSIFGLLFNLYLRDLGFTDATIGQILSKVALGAAVAALPAAFLFRSMPARTLLVGGAALASLGYVFQASFVQPELLLLVAFLTGMVLTIFRLSIAPVVMKESASERRPFLFSASFGVFFLSAILGSAVGGALPHLVHVVAPASSQALRLSLFAAAAVTLASTFPFLAMRSGEESQGAGSKGGPGALEQIQDLLEIDWGLHLKLILPSAMIGLGAGLIIPFLNLYFKDRFGLAEGEIGILFSVMQGFMVAGNLFGPAVSRRLGLVLGVVATQLLSVPFMIVLAVSHLFPLVALCFFLRGGLMNMNQPLVSHFAMEVVPERDHAITNSLLSLSWYLAWTVSADIGGTLIERKGYEEPLLLAAALYVGASVLYWIFFKDVAEARLPRTEVEIPEA